MAQKEAVYLPADGAVSVAMFVPGRGLWRRRAWQMVEHVHETGNCGASSRRDVKLDGDSRVRAVMLAHEGDPVGGRLRVGDIGEFDVVTMGGVAVAPARACSLATALGFWSGRVLATGTAWAGLCLIHHHHHHRPRV